MDQIRQLIVRRWKLHKTAIAKLSCTVKFALDFPVGFVVAGSSCFGNSVVEVIGGFDCFARSFTYFGTVFTSYASSNQATGKIVSGMFAV